MSIHTVCVHCIEINKYRKNQPQERDYDNNNNNNKNDYDDDGT